MSSLVGISSSFSLSSKLSAEIWTKNTEKAIKTSNILWKGLKYLKKPVLERLGGSMTQSNLHISVWICMHIMPVILYEQYDLNKISFYAFFHFFWFFQLYSEISSLKNIDILMSLKNVKITWSAIYLGECRHGWFLKSWRFQSQIQSVFFLNSFKKQKVKSQIVFECGCVNFSSERWVIVSENSRRKKGPRSPTHLKHSVKRLSHFSCFSKISRNEQRKWKTKHFSF